MTDREALAAAIADHPREDTPRLALADWFDENGQPSRATFVRLQCEAARLRPGHPRRLELLRRADEEQFAHEEEWLGDAEHLVRWEFDRGFLRSATITADNFRRHGEKLLRREPVGRLTFVDDRGNALNVQEIREVVEHPAFARVTGLVINAPLVDGEAACVNKWLRALAGAKHVTRLRSVQTGDSVHLLNDFSNRFGMDRGAFEAFCSAEHLRSITALRFNYCPLASVKVPDRLLWAIADAPFAANLERLELVGCRLTKYAYLRVATDPLFANLRRLNLLENTPDPGVRDCLFNSTTLTQLCDWHVTGRDLKALARSPAAGRVRALRVHCDDDLDRSLREDRRGWREVLKAVPPPRTLELFCHNPGARVFDAMVRRRWLRRVHTLTLDSDSQYGVFDGTDVFRRMFAAGALPRLGRLRVDELADAGFAGALATWPGLGRLEEFDLTDDYFGRLFPEWFEPAGPLASLRELRGIHLRSDADVDRVARWEIGPGLRSLVFAFTGVLSERAVAKLFRLPQFARVESLRCYADTWGQTPMPPDPVVKQLIDPKVMPRLRSLDIGMWCLEEPLVARLRPRFGPRLFAPRG